MKKGIIMEIDDCFLTLLTPEGEFLRTRKNDNLYTVGEEISFFPSETVKSATTFRSLKDFFQLKPIWAVLAAVFLFFSTFIPFNQNNNAYAYMSIDAEPSIELGINKKMQVVKLTGFNQEGKDIIAKLSSWKKQDVTKVTQTILAKMEDEGFMKDDKHVIISTVWEKQPEKNLEQKLQKNIDKIKAVGNDQQIELTVLSATKEERKKATELGITAGKYQESKRSDAHQENKKAVEKKEIQPPATIKEQMNKSNWLPRTEGVVPNNQSILEKNWNGLPDQWNKNRTPLGQLKKEQTQPKIEQFKQKNDQIQQKIKEDYSQFQKQTQGSEKKPVSIQIPFKQPFNGNQTKQNNSNQSQNKGNQKKPSQQQQKPNLGNQQNKLGSFNHQSNHQQNDHNKH